MTIFANQIVVGAQYYFRFTPPFDTLNGAYFVNQIATYDKFVDQKVDFVALYASVYPDTTAATAALDFDYVEKEYRIFPVLELTQSDGASPKTYYMPTPLLSVEPDPTVVVVYPMVISTVLGEFRSADELQGLVSFIDSATTAITGVPDRTAILVAEEDKRTIPLTEYATIVQDRAAAAQALQPHVVTIQQQALLIAKLQGQVNALKTIIANFS